MRNYTLIERQTDDNDAWFWQWQPQFSRLEMKLWAIVVSLLAVDVVTTWYVIGEIGLHAELNPFMGWLMAEMGRGVLIPTKVFLLAFGLWMRPQMTKAYHVPALITIITLPVAVLNTLSVAALTL